MALETPEASEVVSRMQTDVAREVPTSNPRLRNSWLWGVVVALANRVYDFYYYLQRVALQFIPDTATGDWLARWAAIWGRTRNPATPAAGIVVFNADAGGIGTNVPEGTSIVTSDGLEYDSTGDVVVAADSRSTTLTCPPGGSTAIAVTASDHGLSSAVRVTIAGATPNGYNGTVTITVTAADGFTYALPNDLATPATGTITASWTSLDLPVESVLDDADQNQVADTVLSLQSPIADVDTDGQVDFDGLTGGADQEDDEALRIRYLERLQNPIAHFNVAAIEQLAKSVTGVTRVWVREVTPAVGQVTVHFMRDNDTDPIPSGSSLTDVETAIQAFRPATSDSSDVIISAPVAVPMAFTFTALSPNTSTMQAAITANLERFYAEDTEVDDGVTVDGDVLEVAYLAAIYNTVDMVTGETVSAFTITAPSGDETIAAGEIGTLGVITYP